MSEKGWDVARLDAIEREGQRREWIPIRRHFGIAAFGVNAWSADEDGFEIIGEHDETSIQHEELYIVVDGHVVFTVDGKEIDAPTGTILFVRDPAVRRAGRTKGGGATVLAAGAKPGEAFRVAPWEINSEVFPLFDRGEFAEAKRRLEQALADNPESPGLLYNIACAEARLGEPDAALEHLRRAVEIDARFAGYAADDDDLAPLRDDPRFPAAPA